MYAEDAPLWQRYEQACDFLEDDLESGYVRVLQEMIAAGWSDPPSAPRCASCCSAGTSCSPTSCAEAEAEHGPLGPFTAEELGTLIGNAFIGSEALLLLGFDRQTLPIRSALRRVGALSCALGGGVDEGELRAARGAASSSATASSCTTRSSATATPTIVLLPTWSIIHSRFWKLQIPYLARRHRVVTFDGRGRGRSGRPSGARGVHPPRVRRRRAGRAGRHRRPTEAVLVGSVVRRAVGHPARRRPPGAGRSGSSPSAPAVPLAPELPERQVFPFEEPLTRHRRAGRSTTGTTGSSDYRGLPRVLLRADVHRGPLDQADRGLRGLGRWRRSADAGRRHPRAAACCGRELRRRVRPGRAARCS